VDYHPRWAAELVTRTGIPIAKRAGSWSGETAVRRRDGREISVSQVILAYPAAERATECFSTIIRDITPQKQVEAQLRETAAAWRVRRPS
jgi:PAS domain S-box-containing protein